MIDDQYPSPSNILPNPPKMLPSSFLLNVPYDMILLASLLIGSV
jgi:hypothetical protein